LTVRVVLAHLGDEKYVGGDNHCWC
jgi:hypothetical protein